MASPRQLAYKDRSVWELEQVVSAQWDDCDGFTDRFVFPDLTTRVPLVIHLSQEEWTTLYSAVLTGADLSYPNTSHDVEQSFLQTVNCPMNQFCAAMIDCLENDPDVWAALLTLLSENGVTGGVGDGSQVLGDDILGENLLPAGYTCTDDKAFGMALAVVESINDATTEVLQAIEIVTNPVEIASELADNIPGIGVLASASDTAAWIQNTAKEQYDLAWSDVVRDELACAIWCEFKEDCVLNYDRIFDVYLSKSGAVPPPGGTLQEWVVWLLLLPFVAPTSTVATVSLMGLLAMRYGGKFGFMGLGIRSLQTVMALAADDSSSDWSIVCDACTVLAEPVVPEFNCSGGDGFGSLEHLGGTRWRLSAGAPQPERKATIRRLGGGCFKLSNVGFNFGSATFFGWQLCEDICDAGSTPPGFAGNDYEEFTWVNGPGNFFIIDFDFFGVA